MSDTDNLLKRIEKLQNELDEIKELALKSTVSQDNKVDKPLDFFEGHDNIIQNCLEELHKNLKEVMSSNIAVTICTGRYKMNGRTEGWEISGKFKSLNEIPENEITDELEPFTNPRRIKIMKVLFNQSLQGNELSKLTGLVGGQLYHHLSILEKSDIIERNENNYSLTSKGARILFLLATIAGDIYGEKK
ncbi:regulatory protein, arsR family [Caldanaerobius fijiensis DSM 17918]|uniref:Regulatory protein, arsR family n=1 Tax=Caldanaerobius fijiensis DSM 17918 TaxID=1121256 RepID=A0A1M5E0J2_9THEO|nr:winged helix-turn-helix domain-containing protein [Caldanaerobius fijiensis]SHF72788.1 regulatory protein, arsR family [Caldanaerobius fijiensis DSM 17918]